MVSGYGGSGGFGGGGGRAGGNASPNGNTNPNTQTQGPVISGVPVVSGDSVTSLGNIVNGVTAKPPAQLWSRPPAPPSETYAPPAVPQGVINAAAGFGAPLGAGFVRGWMGIDGGIDYNSGLYRGAQIPGTVVGVIAGGGILGGVRGVATTSHGATRIAGAGATRGGVLSASGIAAVRAGGRVMTQADGATVSILQNAAGRFNVVVEGQRGIITTFENLSQGSLARLARNYGWK